MGLLQSILNGIRVELEKDEEYRRLSEWFSAKVLLESNREKWTLFAHKGRVIEIEAGECITGADFVLGGPEEEWIRLLKKEIAFAQGINPFFGRLYLKGNIVMAANNMSALSHLIRIMQAIFRSVGGEAHAYDK